MAQKDASEKILESYNDVFSDIVNVLLFKGRKVLSEEELEDQAPRSYYKADGKIHEIERDVAKRWRNGNVRVACIGFENQTASDPDMPLRVIGYDGAEYRAQLLNKQEMPQFTIRQGACVAVYPGATSGEVEERVAKPLENFALQTYGNHWVWSSQLPVWTDVCSCVQELSCNLVEHLTLEWDTLRQNNVER